MHSWTSAHLKPWTAQDVITLCSSHSCLTDFNSFVLWRTSEVVPSFPVPPPHLPPSPFPPLLPSSSRPATTPRRNHTCHRNDGGLCLFATAQRLAHMIKVSTSSASDLNEQEEHLHDKMPPHRARVLEHRRILFFRQLLQEPTHARAEVHNDVFLDSKERHVRPLHCASACHDSLVLEGI